MIQTKEPVRDVEEFPGAWLKARERVGTFVEAEILKNLAARGFQQFGRGVVCLAYRNIFGSIKDIIVGKNRKMLVRLQPSSQPHPRKKGFSVMSCYIVKNYHK